MNRGYSVEEAARVLGIPTERVWDLVARGVFSGARGEDGTWRVNLGGATADASDSQPPGPDDSRPMTDAPPPSAGAELSPFRELLTEFRHLTERYGQALLALGEARGEVASLNARVDALETRIDLRLPFADPASAAATVSVPPVETPRTDEPAAVIATPPPVEPEPTEAEPEPTEAEPDVAPPHEAVDTAEAPSVDIADVQDGIAEAVDEAPIAEAETPEGAPEFEATEEAAVDAGDGQDASVATSAFAAEESEEVAAVAETVEAAATSDEGAEAERRADEESEAADAAPREAEGSNEADHAAFDAGPTLPDVDLPQGDLPSGDDELETIDDLLVLAEGDAAHAEEAAFPEEPAEEPTPAEEPAAEEAAAPEEPAEAPTPADEPAAEEAAAPEEPAEAPTPADEPAAEEAAPDDVTDQPADEHAEPVAEPGVELPSAEDAEPAEEAEPTPDPGLPEDGAFAIEGEPTQRRRNNRLGEEIAAALARADDPSPPELPNGTDQGQHAAHADAPELAEPPQPTTAEPAAAPIQPSRQWPPFARRTEAGEEPLLWIGQQPEDESDYAAEMEVGSAGWQTDVSHAPAARQNTGATATDDLGSDPYPDQAELIDALGWEEDEVEAIRSLLAGRTPQAREAWPATDPDVREPGATDATEAPEAREVRDETVVAPEPPEPPEPPAPPAPQAEPVAPAEPEQAVEQEPPAAHEALPRASWPAADRVPEAGTATPAATPEATRFELPGAADLDQALAALRRRSSEEAAAEEGRTATDRGGNEPPAAPGENADEAADAGEGSVDEPADAPRQPPMRPASGLEDPAWSRRSPAANAYRRLRRFLGG